MAFSNSPQYDTRSTVRMPVCYNLDYFMPSQFFGQGFINMIPFGPDSSDSEETLYGLTRPGLSVVEVGNNGTGGNFICRGMYIWEKTVGTVYYFVVCSDGASTNVRTSTTGLAGSWTVVNSLTFNLFTPVRFCEFIDSTTNTKSLIMVDGQEGYVFTSNAAGTKIVDADFPSPHVPFPVYLDGYLFLAKANTGDIYNSDLNNPASWTAGSFISAELYPDDVQALVKVKNYLLAIGTESGEFFYDAGNSPGTPLARVDGATLPFGTRFPNTIASDKDTVMFLGSSTTGGAAFRLVNAFQFHDIEAQGPLIISNAGFSSGARAGFFRYQGELHYFVHAAGGDVSNGSGAHGYTYSIRRKMWSAHIVTDLGDSGNQFQWPVYYMQSGPTTGGFYNTTYVAGHKNGCVFLGTFAAQGYDTIPRYATSPINIHQQVVFPPATFGTMNIKTMSRVSVNYERPQENTTYQPITFTYSDVCDGSQYATPIPLQGWSTPASSATQVYPSLTQLGQFRRRQMALAIPGGVTRIHSIEVDINKGTK